MLLRSHLGDFFGNSPRVRGLAGWAFEITENPLIAIVQMPTRAREAGEPDVDALRLDATFYDTWPVAATFVEACDGDWRRARIGSRAFPFLHGSPGAPAGEGPGFPFALHDDYEFPGGPRDQLICFSFNFGYYTSNHSPEEGQRWRSGVDRLDATLSRIHAALTGPAYAGPSSGTGQA